MKVDNEFQPHRLSRNYTEHWKTPATKSFTHKFTPFPKRTSTFQVATAPPLRANKFMAVKAGQCSREGCNKEKLKRDPSFNPSEKENIEYYASQYCSESCKEKAERTNQENPFRKSRTSPVEQADSSRPNPFMKCASVMKPSNFAGKSFQVALRSKQEDRKSS